MNRAYSFNATHPFIKKIQFLTKNQIYPQPNQHNHPVQPVMCQHWPKQAFGFQEQIGIKTTKGDDSDLLLEIEIFDAEWVNFDMLGKL